MDTTLLSRGGYGYARNDSPTGEGTPSIFQNHVTAKLTKPTLKRNPPVNGYRKPSSYLRQVVFQSTGGFYPVTGPFKVPCTYEYDGVYFSKGRQDYPMYRSAYFTAGVNWPKSPHNVNNLRMRLLNNVRNEVLDVSMVLAEIQGTANTLGNNLVRLGRSMDALKKGNPRSFYYLLTGRTRDNRQPTEKFLRETAGAYLEWKYGIMPTMYDIQGACKGLDMSQDGSLFDNPPLLVARTRLRSTATKKEPSRVQGPGINFPITVDVRYTVELKARCDYRVSGDVLRGLNRYGLGLGSVATVAFDKTPFSFVLNMALPIAELIKAWTALAGVDVVGYCETLYEEAQVLEGDFQVPPNGGDTGAVVGTYKGEKVRQMSRVAFDKPPMPLPFIRNPISVGNVSTALALFTQLRQTLRFASH